MAIIRYIMLVMVCGLCAIGYTGENDQDYILHDIKKGESISLICIDYYGHYSNEMGNALKALNPSVKNLNVIYSGDKLKLTKPVSAASVSNKNDTPSLFEKKMNITQGVVTCIIGKVSITRKGGSLKVSLTVNSLVYPGDVIETAPDGRVEIIVNRESVMRMKENTRLTLGEFRDKQNNKGKTTCDIKDGTLWTKVKKFADKISRFELSLPTAVAGVYGTVYETSVAKDSSAEVKVYSGEVSVQNQAHAANASETGTLTEIAGPSEVQGPQEVTMETWIQIVRSMQKISIDKKGTPSQVTPFTKQSASSWEQWNEERDKRISELFVEKE